MLLLHRTRPPLVVVVCSMGSMGKMFIQLLITQIRTETNWSILFKLVSPTASVTVDDAKANNNEPQSDATERGFMRATWSAR